MPPSENDVMHWNRVGLMGPQGPRCSWKDGDEEAVGVGGGLACPSMRGSSTRRQGADHTRRNEWGG